VLFRDVLNKAGNKVFRAARIVLVLFIFVVKKLKEDLISEDGSSFLTKHGFKSIGYFIL